MPLIVLAQAEAGTGNLLTSLLPFLLIGVVFWFLVIRPQRKRQKEQRELLSSIGIGDRVRTIGGIYGRVRELGDDDVVITVEDGGSLRILRRAIAEKIVDSPVTED